MSFPAETVRENVHIRLAEDPDRENWDEYALSSPTGTAYQLFGWGRAVERAYGFKCAYLLAESDGKICGIMPCISHWAPLFGGKMVSLPYCDCGGILANNDDITRALCDKAVKIAGEKHYSCYIRSALPVPWTGDNRTNKVRMVLELPKDSKKLLESLKSKVRSQVRKPIREGLEAIMGGRELVPEFYRIFAYNMRDLGSPVHSREWFEAITEEFGERARVAVVYTPKGEAAAAGIALFHSVTVSLPWASSLRSHNHLNPNMLLYWTFLAHAADQGYTTFDFGRSSPGEGTWRFKQQWGAEPQPLYWYEISEGRKRSQAETREGDSAGRRIAAGVWRRLPEGMANVLGPRIRKYISL